MLGRSLYISIGLLSASIIAFQLALMHLLSMIQWSHFAYMVISVAMLGFGASGTVLVFTRSWMTRHVRLVLPLLMFLTSLSMAGMISLAGLVFVTFDSFLLFLEKRQVLSLLLTYLCFFLPFLLGALAIGLVYIMHVSKIGILYFSDLLGSGLGSLVSLALFWLFFPAYLPIVIALLPLLAGFILLPREKPLPVLMSGIACLLFLIFQFLDPPQLKVSEFKSISRALNLPDASIVEEVASPYGHVQVVHSPVSRHAPGLSLNFQGEVPIMDVVFNNGDWFGVVDTWKRGDSMHILGYTTSALPFRIRRPERVLVLEAGTGQAIAHAFAEGATEITAVEPHGAVERLLRTKLATATDSLVFQPGLRWISYHPRSYLMADTLRYDLILLPTLSTFGGSAGINALQEQYLYTREALREMLERLSPTGMLAITTWMDYPYRYPLKLTASLAELLDEQSLHLLAIRSWGTVTYVLMKQGLSPEEEQQFLAFSEEMSFDPLLMPGLDKERRMHYNWLQDTSFLYLTDQLLHGDRASLYRQYGFNIRPSTDQKPYFSQFIKVRRWKELQEHFGSTNLPFIETGYILVGVTLVQITLVALVLILLPLLVLGWRGRYRSFTVLHFSGLGIGFMFIEIVLIQQFILFLGHPIYAAAVVLCGLLLFSGLGSLYSQRQPSSHLSLVKAIAWIILLGLILVLLINPLLRAFIHLAFPARIMITLMILAPIAFFMGIPFPMGLSLLSTRNNSLTPWAWGINGCWSVMSTALATLVAVELGFSWVMILALMAYAVTGMSNLLIHYRGRTIPS